MEAEFQFIKEVTKALDMYERRLSCICKGFSTFDKGDYNVSGMGLNGESVIVGYWYGEKPLLPIMGRVVLVRLELASRDSRIERRWSPHFLHMIQIHVMIGVGVLLRVSISSSRLGRNKKVAFIDKQKV